VTSVESMQLMQGEAEWLKPAGFIALLSKSVTYYETIYIHFFQKTIVLQTILRLIFFSFILTLKFLMC